MKLFHIERRRRLLVNTDPQRRCYNGCLFSSEWQWSAWETLNRNISADELESSLKFWRELNEYAVSQRGEDALCEFRAIPSEENVQYEPS